MSLNLFSHASDLAMSAAAANPAIDLDAGMMASFAASYDARRKFKSSDSEQANRYDYVQGVIDRLNSATGEEYQNPEGLPAVAGRSAPGVQLRAWEYAKVRNRLAQLAKDRPDLGLGLLTDDEIRTGTEEIGRRAVQTELGDIRRQVSRSSSIGAFGGEAVATLRDPVNAAATALSLPLTGGRTILGAAAQEGAVGGASELLVQAQNYDYRRRVDPQFTLMDAAEEVGVAAGASALLGGSVRAIAKAWEARAGIVPQRLKDKANIVLRAAAAAKSPFKAKNVASDVAHNQAVAKASEDLMMGRPVELPPETFLAGQARPGRVYDADGRSVGVSYEVVEARDLVASHTDDFLPNPGFPPELQPRARERPITREQVNAMAAGLQPERLGPSPQADSGAPIVGPDGLVESGNGRVLAIRKAYRSGGAPQLVVAHRNADGSIRYGKPGQIHADLISPDGKLEFPPPPDSMGFAEPGGPFLSREEALAFVERNEPARAAGAHKASGLEAGLYKTRGYGASAASYRNFLKSQGFDIDGMDEPILVARRITDLPGDERLGFVTAANRSTAMRLSATEQALSDARLIDPRALEGLEPGDIGSAGNRPFVRSFLSKLPRSEHGAMVDADGNLSAEGARRISAALLGRAYGDPVLLARALEDADSNIKALAGALSDAAGSWSRMRDAVARGAVPQGMDITDDVLEALRLAIKARDEKVSFKDLLAQAEMLDGPSDIAKSIGRFLFRDGDLTKPASRAAVADMLQTFAREAEKNVAGERLFGAALSEADVLRTALSGSGRPDLAAALPGRSFIESQPARRFDEIYTAAPRLQEELTQAGDEISAATGAKFKNPGVKDRATAEAKMARKGYRSTSQITDIVRGGFVVTTTAQADRVVAMLSERFRTLDEGWGINDVGYFDRKVLVQFSDGTVGEVQIWEKSLLDVKNKGHALYEQWRALPGGDPGRGVLAEQQKRLYAAVFSELSPDWVKAVGRGGRSGNVEENSARNAASSATPGMSRPESLTSAGSTSVQPSPGASTAQARLQFETAGRYSQLTKNVGKSASQSENRVLTPEMQGEAEARIDPEAVERLAEDPALADGVLMEANRMMAEELTGGAKPALVPVRTVDAAGNETEELRPLIDVMDELDEEIAAAERIEACASGGATAKPASSGSSAAPAGGELGTLMDVLRAPRRFDFDEAGNITGVQGVERGQPNEQLGELLDALRAPKTFRLDGDGNVTSVEIKK